MYKENTNDIVKEKAEKINEDITKTVKLMRERPYMSSEKKREKILDVKDLDITFNFGSRASLRPSATRLKLSIKRAITIIGGII